MSYLTKFFFSNDTKSPVSLRQQFTSDKFKTKTEKNNTTIAYVIVDNSRGQMTCIDSS